VKLARLAVVVLLAASCGTAVAPSDSPPPASDPTAAPGVRGVGSVSATRPLPDTCDAGTEIWVQRVLPLVLGRKPHGAAEVKIWSSVAEAYGRETVVRALTEDDGYLEFWKAMVSDMIKASRSGPDEDLTCFQSPKLLAHDGSLTEYIRTHAPDDGAFKPRFDMADVVIDALVADDLGPVWQANVFARTNYIAICTNQPPPREVEEQRRVALGDEFLETYPNRSLTCIACHNSEFSVTDNSDPALDHTWGVPALFEKALFGDSAGPIDADTYYAMHRFANVVKDQVAFGDPGSYPLQPWGMDESCGSFARNPPRQDYLSVDTSYFGADYGTQGSLFDLEAMLRTGADAMNGTMIAIAPDESVGGDEALSYLTGQHIVDQVWDYAMGAGLTIPYGFSRNEAQQRQLQELTDQFVSDGWSLRELLVSIATNPLFNDGLPGTCGSAPYGADPIVNPYSADDPDPTVHGNGAGDLVHRQFARALIRSARDELEWPVATEYFGNSTTDPDYDLEVALGVFLSRSISGFNGTDFQGALSWEQKFATCSDPAYPGGFMARVKRSADQADATVEQLALAVKDRLTARGVFEDDEERDLTEDLLGVPLPTKVADVDPVALDRNLGLYCGVLTLSPDFFVTLEPRAPGPVPALPLAYDVDCRNMVDLLALEGITATCDNWMPVLPPR
jgi:hypothetical protein